MPDSQYLREDRQGSYGNYSTLRRLSRLSMRIAGRLSTLCNWTETINCQCRKSGENIKFSVVFKRQQTSVQRYHRRTGYSKGGGRMMTNNTTRWGQRVDAKKSCPHTAVSFSSEATHINSLIYSQEVQHFEITDYTTTETHSLSSNVSTGNCTSYWR